MIDSHPNPELEKKYAVVEGWIKDLSETSIAKELDRKVLRDVFESMGANFNIGSELQEKFGRIHYDNSIKSDSVKAVLGSRYKEFWYFCKTIAPEKGIVYKESGNKDTTAGLRHFLIELVTYAATTEEEFSSADFITRVTGQAVNGKLREIFGGVLKLEHRMAIRVNGYNTIHFTFDDKPEELREGPLPFAPASFPPDFPNQAWEFMKTWKK